MWLDELHDDMAVLEEHHEHGEPIAWARALRGEHGRAGAIDAVLGASTCPAAFRQLALEELAL
jgi:hypothetical protein